MLGGFPRGGVHEPLGSWEKSPRATSTEIPFPYNNDSNTGLKIFQQKNRGRGGVGSVFLSTERKNDWRRIPSFFI